VARRLEAGLPPRRLLRSALEQQWEARRLAAVMVAQCLEGLSLEVLALGPSLLSNRWEALVLGLVEVLEGVAAADLARGAEVLSVAHHLVVVQEDLAELLGVLDPLALQQETNGRSTVDDFG